MKQILVGLKVQISKAINPFGGLNFVLDQMHKFGIDKHMNQLLPSLSANSQYSWSDIFYSFASIYFCGGSCIEDSKTVLAQRDLNNPFFKLTSPDTILRRFMELAVPNQECLNGRTQVIHKFNYNELLSQVNIKMLDRLGVFEAPQIILDYDNTVLVTGKKDSQKTYTRDKGYQPGVCFLNEDTVLYVEGRNGLSSASAFQGQTLKRIFKLLKDQGVDHVDKFRADSASYQYEVVKLLAKHVDQFYISTPERFVRKYFSAIDNWQKTKDKKGNDIWVGDIMYTPFERRYKRNNEPVQSYRLVVKKKLRADGQASLLTQDAYSYLAILTSDMDTDAVEALKFYYHRGAAEKQFDILKNDFGWKNLPFSKIEQNHVFLLFTAMVKNLYKYVLEILSKQFKTLTTKHRIKRFVFSFIAIPAKWIWSARQWQLRIFGSIHLRT